MHVGLKLYLPFLSLACTTFTCCLGEGVGGRVRAGYGGLVIWFVGPGSEASLHQDCSIACSGPSLFGGSPGTY